MNLVQLIHFQQVQPITFPTTRPDYWLVNGRSLPDTVLAGKYNINYQKGLLFNPNPAVPPQGPLLTPVAQLITYYPAVTAISSAGGDEEEQYLLYQYIFQDSQCRHICEQKFQKKFW